LSVDDLHQLAAVEAGRLRDAAGRPAYERREILADLASRLEVLLEGLTDPAVAPLRELVALLAGDRELEARWTEALRVLTDFGGEKGAPAHGGEKRPPALGDAKPSPSRKAFWKR
jgi:Ca-activated chloride channel family protein